MEILSLSLNKKHIQLYRRKNIIEIKLLKRQDAPKRIIVVESFTEIGKCFDTELFYRTKEFETCIHSGKSVFRPNGICNKKAWVCCEEPKQNLYCNVLQKPVENLRKNHRSFILYNILSMKKMKKHDVFVIKFPFGINYNN